MSKILNDLSRRNQYEIEIMKKETQANNNNIQNEILDIINTQLLDKIEENFQNIN
jgi:hypothetical protein